MMTLVLAALVLAARAEDVLPHRLTFCAALLSDPMFEEAGRRITADEAVPADLPAAMVPYPSHVQDNPLLERMHQELGQLGWESNVLRYSREIVGEADIETYLRSAFGRAVALQTRIDADPTVPAWDREARRDFAWSSVLPTLISATQVWMVLALVNEPAQAWWAGPIDLIMSGLVCWVTKDHHLAFAKYLRAVFSRAPGPILRRGHGHYESDLFKFSRFASIAAKVKQPYDFIGPRIVWFITPEISRLLVEPLRTDDAPATVRNYEDLLVEALAERFRTDRPALLDLRVVEMNMRLFLNPQTMRPHLRVHVEMHNPVSGWRGRGPDELRRLDARGVEAAPPVLEPGGLLPQGA